VVFGDSLADNGNATEPDGTPLRKSDGLVLSEAVLEDFGIPAESTRTAFNGSPPAGFRFSLNYAFVGATSGVDGSEARGVDLGGVPVGLQSQVERFLADSPRGALKKARLQEDALVFVGANDVFEFLDRIATGQIGPMDIPAQSLQLIDTITGQISDAARTLDAQFDDVVIASSPPLSQTPLLQGLEPLVPGVGGLADGIATAVNQALKIEFDLGRNAVDDIFVVDAIGVFNQSIEGYENQFGTLDGFWFDEVHPSSLASTDFLSDAIASEIRMENLMNPNFEFA
jgi:hypothetical protein